MLATSRYSYEKIILGALALLPLSFGAQAIELSSAIGSTSQGGLTARAGVGVNWDQSWLQSSTGKLTGYWDYGYTYWESGKKAGARHSLSLLPFLFMSSALPILSLL